MNIPDSEILKQFDESRNEFKPYGLTCELWKPNLMRKPDRHNEIEINYFPEGSVTYLFQERTVVIPPKRFAAFWALVPHQIIHYEGNSPYFVCTVPFSQFLEWSLPVSFTDRILKGDVIIEASEDTFSFDSMLLKKWIEDIGKKELAEAVKLEMHARLLRLAHCSNHGALNNINYTGQAKDISRVEQMAMYIAQNYKFPIRVPEIGKAVGLHPDYANALFKKTFGCTLNEYINEERISYAQRRLITGNDNITNIAFESGFNSISRFNAAFLHMSHCTPRQFRKLNKNQ